MESAFHQCDPFNVISKLNVKELNLVATNLFFAMLYALRQNVEVGSPNVRRKERAGDTVGTPAAAQREQNVASVNNESVMQPPISNGPASDSSEVRQGGNTTERTKSSDGVSGPIEVKPFHPPPLVNSVAIGDGFEVLRFALRLCAKVIHNPIPQLRSAGKAVLETILCQVSSNSSLQGGSFNSRESGGGVYSGGSAAAGAGGTSSMASGCNKVSLRTAALALLAVFRYKELWGKNGLAEIVSCFLEKAETDKKLFVMVSMVSCHAVQSLFHSVHSEDLCNVFDSGEEITLVFKLLRAGYPTHELQKLGVSSSSASPLKTERIIETMMLLFHPNILPTLGVTAYTNCLQEIPNDNPEAMCKILLALLQTIANSAQGKAPKMPGSTGLEMQYADSSPVAAAPAAPVTRPPQYTPEQLELIAVIWGRTMIVLAQNINRAQTRIEQLIGVAASSTVSQAQHGFVSLLVELQEAVLEPSTTMFTPFVGIQIMEKLVACLTACCNRDSPKGVLTLALSISTKFFLSNIKQIENQARFDQAWLMVLRLILLLHRQGRGGGSGGDEVLAELSLESLKNALRVMVADNLIEFRAGADSPMWWRVSWENIENVCPGFREALEAEEKEMREWGVKEAERQEALEAQKEQQGGLGISANHVANGVERHAVPVPPPAQVSHGTMAAPLEQLPPQQLPVGTVTMQQHDGQTMSSASVVSPDSGTVSEETTPIATEAGEPQGFHHVMYQQSGQERIYATDPSQQEIAQQMQMQEQQMHPPPPPPPPGGHHPHPPPPV